jgi:alpha-L-fucosidase 2
MDLLPALPTAFPDGEVAGIKGRGGFELTITWQDSKLKTVEVQSLIGNNLNLRYNNKLISVNTIAGETYNYSVDQFH